MKNYILFLVLIFSLLSCKNEKTEITKNFSTDLQTDHFNIWVENPKKAKQQLINIGFTAVPDSLSKIHEGQGTAGKYFNFLNGYLELIFVYNQDELIENNENNIELDFTERANFRKNGASPYGIALKVKDYNVSKIPFQKIRYHQDWMEENASIYSAKISKTNLNEPSIFVVYPKIESERFETLDDLKSIPEQYAFYSAFYKHQNGAQKITDVIITSNQLNLNTETIKALNSVENLTVKSGKQHLMELHFDNDIQGKSFDLRPELPLIIYL